MARAPRSPRPLFELTAARVREFIREPGALFWVFVFPVLLAIGLGIAFRSKPPEKYRVALVAQASVDASRMLRALNASPLVAATGMHEQQAHNALRHGVVDVMVLAHQATGGDATHSSPPMLTYRYDPQQPQARAAQLAANDALQRGFGRREVATIREETSTPGGSRYIDFLIPGLIGLNLMGSGMWGIGFVVVQTRTRKLLKRFAVTPMRRSHYLLSFMLSRAIFLVLEVAALIAFGWSVFDVVVHGTFAALALVSLTGAFSFTGIALLVAARPQSVEAASGWMNAVMLPMWLLSGSFFSYERFPTIVQPLIRALPLTAINDALRAVINDGAPAAACWPQLAILMVWGTLAFALALRIFRWK